MKTQATGRFSGKVLILLAVLFLPTLSGCSAAKAKAQILHLFGIMSDEDYQSYLNLVDKNQLNSDNSYFAPELEVGSGSIAPEGSVHVTFAQNSYMNTQYFRDTGFNEQVGAECYLMPGDCIYAPEPSCDNPSSQWYKFDRFCIYAYDETGKRMKELFWGDEENSELVLRVPADPAVSEISVIPQGKYEKRTLELTDFYIDGTEHPQELSGIWIVNGTEVSTERIEISPVEPLFIDLKYDDTQYGYVESNPDSFYHEKGLVRFEVTDANQDIKQFSVELRPLKGMFWFDPSQYPVENGSVTFQYYGKDITKARDIPDGKSITCTLVPAEGYHTFESTHSIFINASDPDKTNANIKDAIKFFPEKNVTVRLPQPAFGGTITYTANGTVLSGETCSLPCGTDIKMEFDHWNGWIVNADAGKDYVVEPEADQTVGISGVDIDHLFTETDKHKPILQLVLDDSMKDVHFTVSTSDAAPNDTVLSYEDGSKISIIPDFMGQNDREIFGGGKIGTGSGITLTITNDTILLGYAIKLEIVTKDTEENESRSVRYVMDLPATETIDLYDEQQLVTSPTVYENVTIKASMVEVSQYSGKDLPHAAVTVKLADEDTPCILKDGDVLESSRDVEITITPNSGYYIKGSKRNNGVYCETMKYSKWEKDCEKILERHPAEKVWQVTLDTSDRYGTCTYKLDNTTITDTTTVSIREGQKLTLVYELTDLNYQISRNGPSGFFDSIFHKETETVSIPVSESLDGQTVRCPDYITVERKEG